MGPERGACGCRAQARSAPGNAATTRHEKGGEGRAVGREKAAPSCLRTMQYTPRNVVDLGGVQLLEASQHT